MRRQPNFARAALLAGDCASIPRVNPAWEEFVVTRDPSGRLFVAHCVVCGQLLAASPDRPITERLASSHRCEMQLPTVVNKPSSRSRT